MLNTLNINLKTDIKTDRPTSLPIKLMSQDKNNNQFILRFTNGGEPVTLDDTYTVEVLTKFTKSGTSRLTSATVRQDYATWEFDTAYITQDEAVYNYVYVRKSGSLVVSADANAFYFDVGLSEIDKDAGRVAEVYDENYEKYLDEFKDNVDFEEIAQAEQERKEAEILRQESYDAKVDTAIVEADVVGKVDSKVTELTPQINSLTAQLAHITAYGAKTSNTGIQNNTAIQSLLDSSTRIVIPDGEFIVRQPLYVKPDTIIELIGTLKLEASQKSNLTVNASSGENSVTVADGSKFMVGDRVTISDDNQPVQGGGTHTRLVGENGIITAINGNVITFDKPLNKNYVTAASAYLATQNSIIDITSANNVTITGTGLLDGNKDEQDDVEPVVMGGSGEEVKAGCCITSGVSDDLTIRGIKIKNAILHNISLLNHDRVLVESCKSSHAHDKNLLIRAVRNSSINGSVFSHSSHEDGITVYSGVNTNLQILNNRCEFNYRAGLLINTANKGIRTANNVLANNTLRNINHRGHYGTSVGDVCIGGGSGEDYANYFTGEYMNIQGLTVLDAESNEGALRLEIKNSLVNGVSCTDTDNYVRDGISVEGCENTVIKAVYANGNNRGLKTDSTTKDVLIDGGTLENNNTILYIASGSTVSVKNVKGVILENKGKATITSGESSVVVSHGLQFKPSADTIKITPTNNLGNASKYWVSDIDEFDFTINVDVSPGTTTATFAWDANATDPLMPSTIYYREGNEDTMLWVQGYVYNTAGASKETDHLHLIAEDAPDAEISFVTDEIISLTGIDTLYIDWENIGIVSASNRAGLAVSTNKTAYLGFNDALKLVNSAFARRVDSLDVSGLTGNYYIRVHARDNDMVNHVKSEVKVYRVWGE